MSNAVLDTLMNSPRIKNLGLKKESVAEMLQSYSDLVIESLLENGHIDLFNGMSLDVVQLTSRVHVLRGVPYKSSRKYKLKLTINDNVYKKIEEYYDKLGEDIL